MAQHIDFFISIAILITWHASTLKYLKVIFLKMWTFTFDVTLMLLKFNPAKVYCTYSDYLIISGLTN